MEYNKNTLNEADSAGTSCSAGGVSGASQCATGDANSLASMAPEKLCVVHNCTPKKKSAKERIEERKRANKELNEAISMNDVKKYTKDRPVRYQIADKPVNIFGPQTEYEKHRHELLKKNEEKKLKKTTNLDYRKSPNYNPLSEIDSSTQFQDGQADEFLAWYYDTFNN